MGAAQDRMNGLLMTVWGPALRAAGFTGSGKMWTLADPTDWAMLGFQTSTSSTASESKFTINLLVVGKSAWEEARSTHSFYGAKPTPNSIALHRYSQRAGFLTHGSDHWWRLAGDGSNEASIANEILTALTQTIVPKLRSEMADQSPGPRGTFEGIRRN